MEAAFSTMWRETAKKKSTVSARVRYLVDLGEESRERCCEVRSGIAVCSTGSEWK